MVIKENFNPDKVFFTSDQHFRHSNIIKFCHRPFNAVDEQDKALIDNWNSVVTKDSNVFMLGDFIFTAHIPTVQHYLRRLKGRIWWVMGNHDYQSKLNRKEIADVVDGRQFDVIRTNINGTQFTMCHFPMMFWDRNSIMLYGHMHGGEKSTASEKVPPHPKMYDVGVDNNNYFPISYYDLMEKLTPKDGI